ncbi:MULTISPECIES: hypothetical protein [unclassified Nesterenkonia]|uniref:hypothetical protein n=1 Tax=unclassified Nesterenkonia TaxID=2629769 RepID=UPI001F4D0094|nr:MULTISPECIES: hypothetical protein [unclassified Nesterenkonia]MCH8560625.1 hypothetical protein [Nesterenkonia sp. DZ6]MCH8570733.1 hypothetical protein [Nesterenkonia sp. AY15]
MNGTPRSLNRLLITLLGVLLIAAGTLTAAAGLNPSIAQAWSRTGTDTWAWVLEQLRSAPMGDTGISWWTVALVGLVVLAILLLLRWIFSQGGGRSDRLGVRSTSSGTTTVDHSLAARAIREAMEGDGEVLSLRVSSWKIKGGYGVQMVVRARRGASPRRIAATAEEAIAGLDTLLGELIPILVHIRAGPRSRSTRTGRPR